MSDKDVLQDREPASDEAVKLDKSREKSVMRMKLWRWKEGVYLLVDSDTESIGTRWSAEFVQQGRR